MARLQAATTVQLLLVLSSCCCCTLVAANACSPFMYPCACGLCPRIVDCGAKAATMAECFCGTAAPGVYAHPSDASKFWMCSFDAASQLAYGVELSCPGRLVFDPTVRVCTVPSAVTQAPVAAVPPPAQQQQQAAAPAALQAAAADSSSSSSGSGGAALAAVAKRLHWGAKAPQGGTPLLRITIQDLDRRLR